MPAARRRDRRGAGGRDQPTQPRGGRSTFRSRSLSIPLPSTSLLLILLAVVAIPALYIVFRGGESSIDGTASPSLSVYERGLVKPNVDYHEILAVSCFLFSKLASFSLSLLVPQRFLLFCLLLLLFLLCFRKTHGFLRIHRGATFQIQCLGM